MPRPSRQCSKVRPDIGQLFVGVHRMAICRAAAQWRHDRNDSSTAPAQRAQQTEALRKMLLAMVDDVRVVLLKLAERLISLRSAALSPEARRNDTAHAEARRSWRCSPLANRLGVWQLKWSLKTSARVLEPHQYHSIARYL